MALLLLSALLLAQSTPVKIVDPSTPTRSAGVEPCTGGKTCLDVKVVESAAGGGGSGPSQVTTDIRDAGILQQQNVDVLAQLALIKASVDARTKPSDTQTISGSISLTGTADVSDRAARLLGKADLLIAAAAPSVTNYLPARLSDGAAYYKAAVAGDNMGRTWNLSASDTVIADRTTVTSVAPVNITVTTSSTQLLAANASRRGYTCQAKSDNAVQVNFREGTTAVTTDPELWPRDAFTHDSGAIHTGAVAGIVSAGTAVVRCWEW